MAAVAEVVVLLMGILLIITGGSKVEGANWCVARSDASEKALQTALDYACGSGADCAPIESTGLCYLPNTIQAHSSYAFNSYYQRKAMAPGSCDFAGTATLAQTDPSYGSCVYPASLSAAGGAATPATPGTTPTINAPTLPTPPGTTTTTPIYGSGGSGGLTPGMGPATDNSKASSEFSVTTLILVPFSFFLVLSFNFQPTSVF